MQGSLFQAGAAKVAPMTGADLRYCGVCWRGEAGVRLHYCDEPLGHRGPCRCHCGVTRP